MSNGEPGKPKNPWAEIAIDPTTLMGAVVSELRAVQDAEGDVKGAGERLRERVKAGQDEVDTAKGALAEKRQRARDRLEEIEITGRAISFTSGTSLSSVPSKGRRSEPKRCDLAGVTGTIDGLEVGSVRGIEITPATTVALHVSVPGSIIPPRRAMSHVVLVNEADYTIAEVPQPEEHQDPR